MKKILHIALYLLCIFTLNGNAKTLHNPNFFDTVNSADSLAIIKITSGESCFAKTKCLETQGRKYQFSIVKVLVGKDLSANSSINRNNLCIGCEYVVAMREKKDKSIYVDIFPIQITQDHETKERQLLYLTKDDLLPIEMSKIRQGQLCNMKLKCQTYFLYRYVSEKDFSDDLIKKYKQTH